MKAVKKRRLAGLLALLCIVMIVLLNGQPVFTNASFPPRGISSPEIAIQVARNEIEVDHILGPAPSLDREVMRFKQRVDFALIPAYLALFLILAAMLYEKGGRFRFVAGAAAVCAIAAAIFNTFENFAVLRLLDISLRQTTPALIEAIRFPSEAKWLFGGLTLVLVSPFFLIHPVRKPRLSRAAGGFELLAAAFIFTGLFENPFLVWQIYPLVVWLALTAALFLRLR